MDDLISLEDAALDLGIAAVTLRAAIARGRFEARKFGNSWVTTRQEVERYRDRQLGQRGRPLESAALPWPNNQAGHRFLYVTFEDDGLSTPERRRIVEDLRQVLGSGSMWLMADIRSRLVGQEPDHRWDYDEDGARPALHFRLGDHATPATSPAILRDDERSSEWQEIRKPTRPPGS